MLGNLLLAYPTFNDIFIRALFSTTEYDIGRVGVNLKQNRRTYLEYLEREIDKLAEQIKYAKCKKCGDDVEQRGRLQVNLAPQMSKTRVSQTYE